MTGRDRRLEELRLIAEGVTITRSSVGWFGERAGRLPTAFGELPEAEQRRHVELIVEELLYTHYYAVAGPALLGRVEAVQIAAGAGTIMPSLVRSNPGRGRAESGWSYVRPGAAPDTLVATRDGLTLSFPQDRLIAPRGGPLAPGAPLHVRTVAGSIAAASGFYIAHSDAELDYGLPLARMYLNVSISAAPSVLYNLCDSLNRHSLPFDFKIASERRHYHRADVAVLYLPRSAFADTLPAVISVLDAQPGSLRPELPRLVLELMPGLGAADDPQDGTSFGQHWCRLLACALCACGRTRSPKKRLSALMDVFGGHGRSLDRPYLLADQDDIYAPWH